MTDNRAWRGATAIAVFGRRTVIEAMHAAAAGHLQVDAVRVGRDTPRSYRTDLRAACRPFDIDPVECAARDVHELSRDARHDQGVAALVHLRGVAPVESFTAGLHGRRAARPTRLIALDNVTNPQNVGMIVRSALAAGMDGVLWPLEGAPWVSGLVIKASAATVFRTPIATCDTLPDGLHHLRDRGFTAFGLTGDARDSVFHHDGPHRAVYVVGSETEGISPTTLDALDGTLAIPMANGVESLNAAVAASVLAFAVGAGERTDSAR
jgi:23S rRNA (guanosine2251-2'-O)-methyltransferase